MRREKRNGDAGPLAHPFPSSYGSLWIEAGTPHIIHTVEIGVALLIAAVDRRYCLRGYINDHPSTWYASGSQDKTKHRRSTLFKLFPLLAYCTMSKRQVRKLMCKDRSVSIIIILE